MFEKKDKKKDEVKASEETKIEEPTTEEKVVEEIADSPIPRSSTTDEEEAEVEEVVEGDPVIAKLLKSKDKVTRALAEKGYNAKTDILVKKDREDHILVILNNAQKIRIEKK